MDIFDPQSFHFEIPAIKQFAGLVPEDEFETVEIAKATRNRWCGDSENILRFPYRSEDEIRAFQLCKSIEMIDHAFENVPLYRDLYTSAGFKPGDIKTFDDIALLPETNKTLLIEAGYERRKAKDTNFRQVCRASTSGSSGKALELLYGLDSFQRETFEFYRQLVQMLGHPLDPTRWIYNLHMSRGWMSSLGGDYPTFTLTEVTDVEALVDHVRRLRPVVFCMLASYMKHLLPMADTFKAAGVELIIVNSETSSRIERSHYSEQYQLPILDEYSSCEVGIIASECGSERYHVNADGLLLELPQSHDEEAGWGRTVITDLRNKHMPFIRYDQGDIARWSPTTTCRCGQHTQGFTELLGRADDCFRTRLGREIPSASLLNLIDSIFTDRDVGLSSYRLVETSIDEVVFFYVLVDKRKPLRSNLKQTLKQRLAELYGYVVDPVFTEQDALSPLSGYKRKKVISQRASDSRYASAIAS